MENVIVLGVIAVLFLGGWHVGREAQRFWRRLETHPKSVDLEIRGWDPVIWGPCLIGLGVTAWLCPVLLLFVGSVYVADWLHDRIWFGFVDWTLARAGTRSGGSSPSYFRRIRGPEPLHDASGRPVHKTVVRPTRVLDLIENRDLLEQTVEGLIRPEGRKAGVEIMEVRFGDPVIPPEILVARQREQLARQMKKAFVQERDAQTERIHLRK